MHSVLGKFTPSIVELSSILTRVYEIANHVFLQIVANIVKREYQEL